MKRYISISLLMVVSAVALQAATPGAWSVKVRAAHLDTADKSDAFTALDIDFAKNAVSVEDKWIPEIDFTYAFTESLVGEIVLTIPQQHTVNLAGVGRLGTLEHLPPTFSLIYEFDTNSPLTPYLSAGLNVTWIMDEDLSVAGVDLGLDDFSFGAAWGAGFKYRIDDRWDFDASIKWIDLDSDVKAGSATLTNAQLDPVLISAGAVFRF